MKKIFIPTYRNISINKQQINEISKKLPKELSIAYSIQYKKLATEVKATLSTKHKILDFVQVLGCSEPHFASNTHAVLLLSSGKFHAEGIASTTNLPVYLFAESKFSKVSKENIDKLNKKKKGAYLKFLSEEGIGILISTKPGQENLKKAIGLKKKLNPKKSYLFISNNIGVHEFENFGLKSWVNTACPRLTLDNSSIINLKDLEL